MDQITVVYSPLGKNPFSGETYHHKSVVFSGSDGTIISIDGYADNPAAGVSGLVNQQIFSSGSSGSPGGSSGSSSGGPFGKLGVNIRELDRMPKGVREVIAKDKDLYDRFISMTEYAKHIAGQKKTYDPLNYNSNTLADKLLKKGGFPLPSLDDKGENWSPASIDHCFLAGTPVDMWPVEAVGLVPDKDGKFDQDKVRAAIWKKSIEQIQTNDWVVSYDDHGLLIPGKVGQTFQNHSKHILDVPVPNLDKQGNADGTYNSLMVTPGHVTYCAKVEGEENRFAGKHVPIMDIIRSDGALMKQDGTLVRAATGAVVGSFEDQKIAVIVGHLDDQGNLFKYDEGMIRIGTKFIKDDGEVFCVADMAKKNGMGIAEHDWYQWIPIMLSRSCGVSLQNFPTQKIISYNAVH